MATVIPKAPALAKPDAFPRWGVESKTANMADVAGVPALPHSRRPGSSGRGAGWRAAVRAPDSSATTWPACRRVLPKDGLRVGICIKTTTSDLQCGESPHSRRLRRGKQSADVLHGCAGSRRSRRRRGSPRSRNRVTSVFTPRTAVRAGRRWPRLRFVHRRRSEQLEPAWRSARSSARRSGPRSRCSQRMDLTLRRTLADVRRPLRARRATRSPARCDHGRRVVEQSGAPAGAFVTGTTTVLTDSQRRRNVQRTSWSTRPGGYYLTATA